MIEDYFTIFNYLILEINFSIDHFPIWRCLKFYLNLAKFGLNTF